MFAKYKKIIIIVLVLIFGFLIWSIFLKADPEVEALLNSSGPSQNEKIGQEIVKALNEIQSINLTREVFDHPIFLILQDYSKEFAPQDVGRSNPFEPIGSISQPAAASNSSSGTNIVNQ